MITVYDEENNCFHRAPTEAGIAAKVKRATDRRLQMITDGQRRKIVGARLSREEHQVLSDSERLGVPVTSAAQLTGTGIPESPPESRTMEYWEAKIKSQKGGVVAKWAELCGLKFERHASNNGLTCMRARNVLYSSLRKGNEIWNFADAAGVK